MMRNDEIKSDQDNREQGGNELIDKHRINGDCAHDEGGKSRAGPAEKWLHDLPQN